jgi:hypothetical protein
MAEQKGMLAEFRLMESIERLGLPLYSEAQENCTANVRQC